MAANDPHAEPGETAEMPPPSKQPKLPRNIQPLPKDIPQNVWKLWPRQVEAHLFFPQARERQITARIQSGKLPCWYCPDGSCRINREHLVAIWGEPEPAADRPNPLSAAGRAERGDDGRRKPLTSADLELDDPVVGMFRECREMLRDARADNALLFKNAMEPITKGVKFLEEMCQRSFERCKELEDRWEASLRQRETEDEYRHLRDLEISRQADVEKRRGEVVSLLKDQLPKIVDKWVGGSLREFLSELDPELVQTFVEADVLNPEQKAKVRRALADLEEQRRIKAKREAAAASSKPAEGAAPAAAAAESTEQAAAGGPQPATSSSYANGAASATGAGT